MNKIIATTTALALGASSLAGCASPGVVSPQVSAAEQTLFDWVCPTLTSGALDSIASLWPADIVAYQGAKQMCANGLVTTPGAFIADFLVIEGIVSTYFAKKGQSSTFRHYARLAHQG